MKINPSQQSFAILIISSLLILLWIYTAFSKLADIAEFKRQMGNQMLGRSMAIFLVWFIPISEIGSALLLIFNKTRLLGFASSTLLMALFTGYIILVLSGYFKDIPCSCGGVLRELGWIQHLWFNIFFLLSSSLGLYLCLNKEKIRPKF